MYSIVLYLYRERVMKWVGFASREDAEAAIGLIIAEWAAFLDGSGNHYIELRQEAA